MEYPDEHIAYKTSLYIRIRKNLFIRHPYWIDFTPTPTYMDLAEHNVNRHRVHHVINHKQHKPYDPFTIIKRQTNQQYQITNLK